MRKRITNISGITPELLRPVDAEPSDLPNWLNWGRVSLFLRGRSALYYGFASLGLVPGDEVLVPAFICKTVTEPLLRAGAVVRFFNVERDMSIDWSKVVKCINAKTKALIIYHYLGLPNNIREAEVFCREHKIRFIEDAAHALFSMVDGRPAGSIGDASIISLRKCIPMSFGAALIVNANDLPLSPAPESVVALTPEAEAYWQERSKYMHQIGWQNSNTDQTLEIPLYSYHAVKLTKYFSNDATHAPLDEESFAVMHNSSPEKVQSSRIRNYKRYHNRLKDLNPFNNLSDGASPLGYPILIKNRDTVQRKLLDEGIETLVHWPIALLPENVSASFPDACYLAESLLSLPVHDQLSEDDIDYVINKIYVILR